MIPIVLLLASAALVGVLHMSAPDHWVTLVILGQSSHWTRSRLLGVGALTAVGHVGVSLVLGFAIVVLGLIVSETVSTYLTDATGARSWWWEAWLTASGRCFHASTKTTEEGPRRKGRG